MKDKTLTRKQLVSELRKPGRVFVWSNLTKDDGFWVEAVKADLINTLNTGNWEDNGLFFDVQCDESGMYL